MPPGKRPCSRWRGLPGNTDDQNTANLYGQFVASTGSLSGSPVTITSSPSENIPSDIVYNSMSDDFMLLWTRRNGASDSDVWGRLISTHIGAAVRPAPTGGERLPV